LNGVELQAEYGSRDSFDAGLVAGIESESFNATINGGYTRTDGISAAAGGSEPDAFRQWRIAGRGEARLTEGLWFRASARHADGRLDIDGFPGPAFTLADTAEYQDTRQTSARAGLVWQGEALSLDAAFAHSGTDRDYFDPASGAGPTFGTRGRSQRAGLRGSWAMAHGFRLDFGGEGEWSRFSSTFDALKTARTASAHALLDWGGDSANLTACLRVDDHSRFGSDVTLGANGSLRLGGGWRLRASYGEGFKAPSLFQLFSDFGNAALAPERSRSYDIAVELGDRNSGSLHAALTAFRRDTRGLIDFVSCFGVTGGICAGRPFGTYDNVGRARAEGVELELGVRLGERLRAQAAWSFVKATDRANGKDLARRPRHALSLSADWRTLLHDLTLGADLRAVSHSFDDAGNFVQLPGHALLTLRASLPVTDRIELYGRIENVTDKRYQTAAGYGAPGRSAYLRARARF
jgi:vitamin B12 transporter